MAFYSSSKLSSYYRNKFDEERRITLHHHVSKVVIFYNPSQGIAFSTRNPVKEYTKAQKEFLYDYYMERGKETEANKVWK